MHIKILLITILKYNKIHIKEKKLLLLLHIKVLFITIIKINTKDDHTKTEQIYDKNNENCATFAMLQGY
jgi:hypothetical protein